MIRVTLIVLFVIPNSLFAQSFKINLSPRHQQKLSSIQSGHKQMGKYYKFLKKDSTKQTKQRTKQAKKEWDSLNRAEASSRKITKDLTRRGITDSQQVAYADSLQQVLRDCNAIINDTTATESEKRAAKEKIKQLSKNKVNAALAKNGHPYKSRFKVADSLSSELTKWWAVMKDTTATDSTRKVAKEKVKDLALANAMLNPKFQGLYAQYKQYGQKPDWNSMNKYVPGMDTLQGIFESTPEELFTKAEGMATQALSQKGNLSDFSKQAGEFDQYKQLSQLSKPESLKAEGKEQMKEQAVDHFAGQEDKLQGAQEKLTSLLGKYQSFTNSSDMSTAVKRTSLEGKSFKERIVVGGNFNIVSTDPVSIDFSPLFGYRFTTKFYMGVGINYRHTFNDSLKYNWYVSPTNTSMRAFANYDVIKNFFAYAEVEHAGLKGKLTEEQKKRWSNNYFIGAGKKFLIHPKLFMTLTALYNLNNERNNPAYPRRFQMRIGFQTSDLAFRKPKLNYQH